MVQRERILAHLSESVDQLAAEATAAIKVEVPGFGGSWNDCLEAEVFGFSQEGIAQSIDVMRRRTMPTPTSWNSSAGAPLCAQGSWLPT